MKLNRLCKIFRNENIRNFGMYGLVLFLMAFMAIIPYSANYSSITKHFKDINIVTERLTDLFVQYFGFCLTQLVFITFCAIGLAGFNFGFLHSKKEADFYHSFPIRRSDIFIVHYFSGLMMFLIPYVVANSIGVMFSLSKYLSDTICCTVVLTSFLYGISYFIICYTISTFAMIITGKKIFGFIGALIIFFAPMVIQSLHDVFSATLSNEAFATINLKYFSPITAYCELMNITSFDNLVATAITTKSILIIIISLLCAFVIASLSIMLYNKRKLEETNTAICFDAAKHIVRDALVILFSMCGISIPIFTRIYNGVENGKMIFPVMVWMAVFGIIAHCIIEIIYNQDYRKLFSNMKHMMISIIISLLIAWGYHINIFYR